MMNSVNEKHPVQKAFPFIAYASSYGSCEDEKARNRIFVRSYAAQKRIYPGTDVLDGPSQKNPKDTRGILQNARRSVTAMDPVLLPLSSALRPKDSSGYEIQPPSDHWDRFNERSRRPVKASPKKPNKVTKECIFPPAEIEYLAMGAMDPFRTYPLRNLPQGTFEECFDYNLSVLWPSLFLGSGEKETKATINAWSRCYIVDEPSCFALCFCALCHKHSHGYPSESPSDQITPAEKEKRLIFLEMESARVINEALRTSCQPITDSLILSALCMANNSSSGDIVSKNGASSFRPPLRQLQWLDIYATASFNATYHMGLYHLIQLRGGLESIELPGLATIISFSDIIAASRLLSCPRFSFVPLQRFPMFTLQEVLREEKLDMETDFGQYLEVGFTQQLTEAFKAMKSYIFLLQGLEKRQVILEDTQLREIADRRNLIQHTMLCLPLGKALHEFSLEGIFLYEACRISGLIFSIGVIFPLPSETAPLPRLAVMLKLELQRVPLSRCQSVCAREILLWILVIGGIAAIDTLEMSWFVSQLGPVAEANDVREWGHLKRCLKNILWFDSACDVAGQRLWYEAVKSHSLHNESSD